MTLGDIFNWQSLQQQLDIATLPKFPRRAIARDFSAADRLNALASATLHLHTHVMLHTQGDAPVVWRGPIVNNAIDRFLMGTAWGDLNVLVVDMPPGAHTGSITAWLLLLCG